MTVWVVSKNNPLKKEKNKLRTKEYSAQNQNFMSKQTNSTVSQSVACRWQDLEMFIFKHTIALKWENKTYLFVNNNHH